MFARGHPVPTYTAVLPTLSTCLQVSYFSTLCILPGSDLHLLSLDISDQIFQCFRHLCFFLLPLRQLLIDHAEIGAVHGNVF